MFSLTKKLYGNYLYWLNAFGAFASPEIFKTLHGNFDIHRNVQRKMEFLILIIFKKSLI